MHNDEAVNAIKFGQLWTYGAYRYDPHEYHGPTLHYATFAIEKLARAPGFDQFTSTRLRLITVLFGAGLLLLLPLVADGLGGYGAVWAALFTAVSPARAQGPNCWRLSAALGVWLFVAFALFSCFLAHPAGALDAIRAFALWLTLAGTNSTHIHPWHFYLHRLLFFHPSRGPVWTEAL